MAYKQEPHSLIDAQAFARAKGVFGAVKMPSDAVQALASEVISRLSQRAAPGLDVPDDAFVDPRKEADIDALATALLGVDDTAATEIMMDAHARGASVETLYLGYLAEAARRLGQWWDEDRVSSVEVVIGAGRIYANMRGLRRLFGPGSSRGQRFRAVFASVPGETHLLGVAMAADLLTMHGWEIDLRAGLDHDALVAEIGHSTYPIIGLSASNSRALFPLARLIVALRVSNPGAWILVCGGITGIEPDVAQMVDADAAAPDLASAEMMMEDYMAEMQGQARG
jgi:MerR family transcriptional regulator, light-induced transcriptional regulator